MILELVSKAKDEDIWGVSVYEGQLEDFLNTNCLVHP